jgi:hypothetical protein
MLARLRSRRTDAEVAAIPGAGRSDGGPGLPRRSSLALALALVVVTAGFGGSASAAVTGLEQRLASSALTSSNKSVTATCPAGKQLLGASGDTTGASPGQVAINDIIPNAALTSVTVQGLEDQNGSADNWSVRAHAICAPPPPGLERVLATSPNDSLNKSVTAVCPAGKRVLGAGGEVSAGGGQVVLDELTPTSSLGSVRVSGFEDQDGTATNWLLRAYAICAVPVAGLERIVATSTLSSDNKTVVADCSAGKQLLGVGGELGGGGGGQVVLDHLTPFTDGLFVTGNEDEDGTSSNWLVRAYAICGATSQRVAVTSPSDSDGKKGAAACPSDMQPTGGGGDITGGGGQVLIEGVIPSMNEVGVTALEDETGFGGDWFLRAYAICSTPLPGLQLVSDTSTPSSGTIAGSAGVTCPSGKRVVGAGGEITGGGGDVVLTHFKPNGALTNVSAAGNLDAPSGAAFPWSVTAVAVCASPPPGLELVSITGEPDSDSAAGITASCPSSKNLLGTGADIVNGGGEVVLDDVRPGPALTSVSVTGLEQETGSARTWSLSAFAICANP